MPHRIECNHLASSLTLPQMDITIENPEDPRALLLTETGKCVACGLCLPLCPTYRLFGHEAESPRGRLALIRGLVEERLAPNPRAGDRLDHCIGCRACERACPSGVRYGDVFDASRVWRRDHGQGQVTLPIAWLTRALLNPRARLLMGYLIRGLRRSFPQRWLQLLPFGNFLNGLPTPASEWQSVKPTMKCRDPVQGEVALFTGCVSELADGNILNAARSVLHQLGYRVHIPADQACCGALSRRQGDPQTANRLMEQNRMAFSNQSASCIVGTSSGCLASLLEAPGSGGRLAGRRIEDICRFLDQCEWSPDVRLKPLKRRVAVHDPCSQRNVLRSEGPVYSLLQRIPDVDVVALPDNALCCGAGGAYALEYPEIAVKVRNAKIDAIRALSPDVVVTTNVGCALHLRAGLREAGFSTELLHPVELLARQLQPPVTA